jgi:uncharacterized repeat protein (TIGR01451 family)
MHGTSASPALRRCTYAVLSILVLLVVVPHLTVQADAPVTVLGITPTPTATATVPSPGAAPTQVPDVSLVDPSITKRGDPALALPGEQVTFTIEATNRGRNAAVDVVITDQVPQYLEIIEVTTTQGTVEIAGQQVTVRAGTIGSGFVVRVVIRTRVAADAPAPLDLTNVAVLRSPNGGERISPPATVVIPGAFMPETGHASPVWMIPAIGLLLAAVSACWKRKLAREAPEPVGCDHDTG